MSASSLLNGRLSRSTHPGMPSWPRTSSICATTTVSKPPPWVFGEDRYLEVFWFPFPPAWKAFRVEAMVHAPAAFEAHGTLVAERDLMVV